MKDKFIILLIVIALVSGFFWSHQSFGKDIGSDQMIYDGIAVNILKSQSFNYQGEVRTEEPFYSLFLAAIYSVFGHNYDAVRVIQVILFAITALIVYLLAKQFFNRKVAMVASLLIALFYPLANSAGDLLREMFFTFLLALLAYVLYRTCFFEKKIWFVFSGIVLGVVVLTNGIAQFLFLFIIANFLIIYRKKILTKEFILKFSLFLISFLLVLSPWLVRNYFQYSGKVTIVPRGGGVLESRVKLMESVYDNYFGHFVGHTLGYYFAEKIYPELDIHEFRNPERSQEEVEEIEEIYEQGNLQEANQTFLKKAISGIFAQPHKYFLMSLLDFIAFNNPIIPRPGTLDYSNIFMTFAEGRYPELSDFAKSSIILTIRFLWLVFFVFVVYAVVKNVRNWPKISWLLIIILYFNLTYSLVHAIPRYALPIYPFYVLLFSVGLFAFLSKYVLKPKI
ncbi:MAG: glycosyltransferase family 39 protein [Candidatus Nealsonbacteria bacterium]